ncbi:MAG: hypothetical protein RJB39_194 [Candidatus Parcubacteria bacterium]|jgi:uncharacterized protein
MKKLFYITILCICSLFVVSPTQAATIKLTKHVTDTANILSADVENALEDKLTAYEQRTTNQFVVVTLPSLPNNSTVETVAYDIFNENKLGQVEKNNGLLFLISTAERKTRFEVGYGLEPVMPDILVGRILRDDVAPLFKAGDFNGGITLAVDKAIAVLDKGEVYTATTLDSTQNGGQNGNDYAAWIFIGFFILQSVVRYFAKSKSIIAGGVVGAIAGIVGYLITGIIYMFGFILLGLLIDWIASGPLGKKMAKWQRGSGGRGGFWSGGSGGHSGGFGGGGGSSGGGGASGGY